MSVFKEIIASRKQALVEQCSDALQQLATRCAPVWNDIEALNRTLLAGIETLPECSMTYAVDSSGILISANIEKNRLDPQWSGIDLSTRPYLKNHLPISEFGVSDIYISHLTNQPALTVMQPVYQGDNCLGLIALDFNIDVLAEDALVQQTEPANWTQYKGDPAIRGTLFMQERAMSAMDKVLNQTMDIITKLMQQQGIFHCKIHFSSSRVSFWSQDDPYVYQIHTVDEIIDPGVCMAYRQCPPHPRTQVDDYDIARVLKLFKSLRHADETIYLRSSSFNIINGMVGLTFSCDGSHYLHYREFLDKNEGFWFGEQSNSESHDAP